jgi:hypothetical protein
MRNFKRDISWELLMIQDDLEELLTIIEKLEGHNYSGSENTSSTRDIAKSFETYSLICSIVTGLMKVAQYRNRDLEETVTNILEETETL